eukprot:882516-Prymnesium_polylepis.3
MHEAERGRAADAHSAAEVAEAARAQWEARLAEEEARGAAALNALRTSHADELRSCREAAAAEEATYRTHMERAERRAAAEVAAAERGREGAVAELSAQL